MTDINVTFTEAQFGAETLHTCKTLKEAVDWAISLLEGDKAVPVRIVYNNYVLWNCEVNDENDLNILLEDFEVYRASLED